MRTDEISLPLTFFYQAYTCENAIKVGDYQRVKAYNLSLECRAYWFNARTLSVTLAQH